MYLIINIIYNEYHLETEKIILQLLRLIKKIEIINVYELYRSIDNQQLKQCQHMMMKEINYQE